MTDPRRWELARTKQEMPTGGEFLIVVDRIIAAFGQSFSRGGDKGRQRLA